MSPAKATGRPLASSPPPPSLHFSAQGVQEFPPLAPRHVEIALIHPLVPLVSASERHNYVVFVSFLGHIWPGVLVFLLFLGGCKIDKFPWFGRLDEKYIFHFSLVLHIDMSCFLSLLLSNSSSSFRHFLHGKSTSHEVSLTVLLSPGVWARVGCEVPAVLERLQVLRRYPSSLIRSVRM